MSFNVARSIFFYTDSRVLGGAENAMFMLLAGLDRSAWEPTLLLEEAVGTEPLRERAAALGCRSSTSRRCLLVLPGRAGRRG